MEGNYERDILGKESDERLRSTQKRKLMKRLSRIKLNKSLENISAFYAAKVKKLKLNNISLAKELSEQRQVSRSWYDTVVSLKEELQHSQESLIRLHYQAKGNEDYEHVVQEAVERRVRAIVEPLEECVSDSLRNAYRLFNNLTEVKQLVTSALSFSDKEQFNFSDMSPESLFGSRPHLEQNSKSPRKNVIHPIVEGHVFHPATIIIPKMSVEESGRYCLQEQAEIGMGVIGEQSLAEIKSTSSDVDSETLDHENRYEENENYYMENAISNDTTDNDSIDDEQSIVSGESPMSLNPEAFALGDNQFSSGSENSIRENLDIQSSEESFKDETLRSPEKAEKADQLCEENLFEGSSWMYLIKGRPKNTKKSETKTCKTNVGISRLCCILPDTSSESEGEHVEIPARNVKHGRLNRVSKYGHSGRKSCKTSVSYLDTGNCSTLSTRDSNDTQDLNNRNDESFLVAPPSSIINDSQTHFSLLNEDSDLEKSSEGEKYENLTTLENKHSTSSSPNLEFNLESVENITYDLDSPMDITECFKEEVITYLPPLTEQCEGNTEAACNCMLKENEISKTANYQNSLNTKISENVTENLELPKISVRDGKKGNKYFKLTQASGTNEVGPKEQIDSRIYDLSLMDASQITPCLTNVWNENVPSNINASPEDLGKKIEDHSIVAEDITKTPLPTFDVDTDVPFYNFPNSCNQINTVTRSKSNRTRNENNKCKNKRKRNAKPLKKKSMKPKNMNFSDDRDTTIFSSPYETEDEDVWTPSKKLKKRKNKCSIKYITCTKKLKLQKDETTRESAPVTDLPLKYSGIHQNNEIIPMLKANDININSNANDIGLNSNANDTGLNSNANDIGVNSNANDNGLTSNANDIGLNSNTNDIDTDSSAKDLSVKMNITVEPQKIDPLCEIPKDMSTLVAASADIMMKHIKKEIKYIASRDTCKVPKLDSKHGGDHHPLGKEEIELFKEEEEEKELFSGEEEEEAKELFNGEETELFNGRPRRRRRRTALKIQSFKEPSLNTKMRSSLGRKPKRIKEKKRIKK